MKYLKKNIKSIILVFICIFASVLVTYFYNNALNSNNQTTNKEIELADINSFDSNDVNYDNTSSGLRSTNVQCALDELYQHSTDYTSVVSRLNTVESNIITLNDVYPVGSIYISVNNTNPGTIFGGTWVSYAQGRTLIGMGSNGTNNYTTVNATGGSATVNYTPAGTNTGGAVLNHTLTVDEIPSHSHSVNKQYLHRLDSENTDYVNFGHAGPYNGWDYVNDGINTGTGRLGIPAHDTNDTGGDGAHNHDFTQPTFNGTQATINTIDPYITVYMWKRTA